MKILQPTLIRDLDTILDIKSTLESDDTITDASIDNADMVGFTQKYISLSESRINKGDFSSISIERSDIFSCEFKNCNFTASKLPNSSWHVVLVDGARCSGMQVSNSTFKNVRFANSKLELMNFRFSTIENCVFEDCVLDDVDFYNAKLKNVAFINCTINNITFASAKMLKVDISKSQLEGIKGSSSLKGLTISYDQLMQLAPYFAAEVGIKIA